MKVNEEKLKLETTFTVENSGVIFKPVLEVLQRYIHTSNVEVMFQWVVNWAR